MEHVADDFSAIKAELAKIEGEKSALKNQPIADQHVPVADGLEDLEQMTDMYIVSFALGSCC